MAASITNEIYNTMRALWRCSRNDIFKDEDQLARWLSNNTSFRSLGKVEQYLPTRHVRMKNKDEFAGWGS